MRREKVQNSRVDRDQRKSYKKPELKVYGKLETIVQGTGGPSQDANFSSATSGNF